MSVRARMVLSSIKEVSYSPTYSQKSLCFTCQYDTATEEGRRFQKATPSGNAEFQIDNPLALEQFKLGESYYLDFTLVPKPE
jgi:hypothetical protein